MTLKERADQSHMDEKNVGRDLGFRRSVDLVTEIHSASILTLFSLSSILTASDKQREICITASA
jgi:hypothetical protein